MYRDPCDGFRRSRFSHDLKQLPKVTLLAGTSPVHRFSNSIHARVMSNRVLLNNISGFAGPESVYPLMRVCSWISKMNPWNLSTIDGIWYPPVSNGIQASTATSKKILMIRILITNYVDEGIYKDMKDPFIKLEINGEIRTIYRHVGKFNGSIVSNKDGSLSPSGENPSPCPIYGRGISSNTKIINGRSITALMRGDLPLLGKERYIICPLLQADVSKIMKDNSDEPRITSFHLSLRIEEHSLEFRYWFWRETKNLFLGHRTSHGGIMRCTEGSRIMNPDEALWMLGLDRYSVAFSEFSINHRKEKRDPRILLTEFLEVNPHIAIKFNQWYLLWDGASTLEEVSPSPVNIDGCIIDDRPEELEIFLQRGDIKCLSDVKYLSLLNITPRCFDVMDRYFTITKSDIHWNNLLDYHDPDETSFSNILSNICIGIDSEISGRQDLDLSDSSFESQLHGSSHPRVHPIGSILDHIITRKGIQHILPVDWGIVEPKVGYDLRRLHVMEDNLNILLAVSEECSRIISGSILICAMENLINIRLLQLSLPNVQCSRRRSASYFERLVTICGDKEIDFEQSLSLLYESGRTNFHPNIRLIIKHITEASYCIDDILPGIIAFLLSLQ